MSAFEGKADTVTVSRRGSYPKQTSRQSIARPERAANRVFLLSSPVRAILSWLRNCTFLASLRGPLPAGSLSKAGD
jgi:hypothetical protein